MFPSSTATACPKASSPTACAHGIHLPDDLCLVEIVDRDGRAVPPGQPGERILVTNLYNPALPLIRFEVTDEVAGHPRAVPVRFGASTHRRSARPPRRHVRLSRRHDRSSPRLQRRSRPASDAGRVSGTPDLARSRHRDRDRRTDRRGRPGRAASRLPCDASAWRNPSSRPTSSPQSTARAAASSNASFPSDVDQRRAGVRAAAVCKVRSRRSARRRATRLTRSMYAMSESRAFSAAGDRRSRFATSQ